MAVYKPIGFLTLLLAFALLVGGCGGKKEEAPAATTAPPTSAPTVEAASPSGDAALGEKVYQTSCVACHGPDAKGIQGLGKSLHPTDSEFIESHTDDEMVEFIKVGRQPDDPLNTTGIAMPPKGGNPAITDEDLHNIVAWLRTLD